MEFKLIDGSYAESVHFSWRMIARNTIKFNFTVHHLLKDLDFAEVHIELYHRYATWQRMSGDNMWENMCDTLDPTKFTPVMSILMKNLRKYTNVRHPCPYVRNETMYLVANKFEVKDMHIPLMPSGPYRMDMTLTAGRKRHPVGFFQIYFDISDHRAIQVWNLFIIYTMNKLLCFE